MSTGSVVGHSSLRRIDSIEGMRGILSVIVVIGHVNANLALWFWGCMEVFFAISGYLIGTIALRYRDSPDFWSVYLLRRALRIWPLYFVVLLSCVGIDVLGFGAEGAGLHTLGSGTIRDLFFVQNTELYFERYPEPKIIGGGYPSTFHHSWSVALEEQFYLVAPWIAWALAALVTRLRMKPLRLAGIVIAFLALCVALRATGVTWWVLLGRMDAFAIGTLAACFMSVQPDVVSPVCLRLIRTGFVVLSTVTAAYMLAYYVPRPYAFSLRSAYEWRHYLGVTLFALFGGMLILSCVTQAFPRLLSPLEWGVFQFLGRLSYSTYLWHVPILVLIRDRAWYARGVPHGFHAIVMLLIVIPFAYLSYRLIEQPPQRHKPRFAAPVVMPGR